MPKALVRSNFFDSGAFSLFKQSLRWAKETGKSQWKFYDTKEFYQYVDDYCAFVKKYKCAIDLFATVDVIMNPARTWDVQKYIEDKHGLRPVPVVHYGTKVKWLDKYMQAGYPLIGIGGLAGNVRGNQSSVKAWLDRIFNHVCDNPDRLPCVKLHGFGFTSWRIIIRYPWASVDSSVWSQASGFGNCYIPHWRKGKWDFTLPPYIIKVTEGCKSRSVRGQHIRTLHKREMAIANRWLEYIGVKDVADSANARRKANLMFFQMFADSLPEYPWPFKPRTVRRPSFFDLRRK